jgi:glyoxylase-like metal-dependent hydrolase (beta-lactamase superfamily II)
MKVQRRFFVGIAIAVGLATFAATSSAQTQPQPISVKPLTGGVYFVQGGAGSNSGFIVGKTGVIVVDAKMTADSAKEMLAAIAKVTPKPVTTVILTHSDADHVNGLAGFPTGLTIIAQENCKKEMEASLNKPGMPAPKDYMPTKTVDKKEATTIDGVRLEMLHWAPAHTSGDLVVYLPGQKIVFTGDIVAAQMPYPLIHLEKNGSSEGWIESMKGILALNAVTFVPGHGDLQTKDDLEKRLASAEERHAKIQELVKQGKSLDEIKQELGEAAAGSNQRFASFTEVVYKELTTK